jgi:hypothetical protein
MTLDIQRHRHFGKLYIAFEPTSTPNKYKFLCFIQYGSPPDTVTFTSHDDKVPLPDPDFLTVHCTIAKIVKVSGLRKKLRPPDPFAESEPRHLHPNGSTDIGGMLRRQLLIDL